MSKVIDLTNKTFGDLKVIEFSGINQNRKAMWLCECECGNKKIVASGSLISGSTSSCGCKSAVRVIHGKANTRLYHIWLHMKQRCGNPKSKDYDSYGKRGIRVCKEWSNDFMSFYKWSITNGYQEELSIDRKDVNGNYDPDNCRWVTNKIQSNNKRTTIFLTINNETKSLSDWSRISGIKPCTIRERLRKGFKANEAVFNPVTMYRRAGLLGGV